jgi:alkanesulfonate monooxygenase SsuD/methylene tetrahydromethanopterin reductase-like flavin-dependent oxidoreductase (luciferase family)
VNPLFNANRLKLGVFTHNGVGQLLSDLPPREVTWPAMLSVAKIADDAGFEALVPYARWKGIPRPAPLPFVPHDVFEPFTWAAGLAQATRYSAIFSTTHIPMMHPIVVAKMATTIDHISGGRFALNVVAGWNGPEFTMFGEDLKPHEDRYAQAAEWMTVLRRLWTEREFDFAGEYYRIVAGESFPKPLQHPHPPIMNAGGSAVGRAFAAEFADLCFVMLSADGDLDLAHEQIASYRALARERFGREIAIWTNATVILGETQADADAEARFLAEHQNDTATQALLATRTAGARALTLESGRELRPTSLGSSVIVGDAHAVAERLHALSDAGIDGVVVIARDFDGVLTRFTRNVLPLLERAGLRAPFAGAA